MNRCTIRAAGTELLVGFKIDGQEWDQVKGGLKSIPGAHWSAPTREWAVPIVHRRRVLAWARAWFDQREISDSTEDGEARRERPQLRRPPAIDSAYAALHLRETAPPEVVAAAHHALVKLHHPDTGHGDHRLMAAVNNAVDVIRAVRP